MESSEGEYNSIRDLLESRLEGEAVEFTPRDPRIGFAWIGVTTRG